MGTPARRPRTALKAPRSRRAFCTEPSRCSCSTRRVRLGQKAAAAAEKAAAVYECHETRAALYNVHNGINAIYVVQEWVLYEASEASYMAQNLAVVQLRTSI